MDEEAVKQVNSLRFSWHEHLLRDREMHKRPIALVFAGHVMHRFEPKLGYAEISLRSAAREFGLDRTSVVRSRDFLIERGWIQRFEPTPSAMRDGVATRYTLAGGPDDLVLTLHRSTAAVPLEDRDDSQASFW
jgi:hypothetical protein